MKDCGDIRSLLDAFADNELSSSESGVVQRHLEHCSQCSGLLEDLLSLKEALREMPRPQASSELREKVVERVRREKRASSVVALGYRRWRLAAAGVAAAALLALAVSWWAGYFRAHEPMYASMLADHRRALSPTAETDMMTTNRKALWRWLDEQTSFLMPASLVSRTKLALLGGRVFKMDGDEVAAIQYRMGRKRVSLFAMESHAPMPPSAQKRLFRGRHLFTDSHQGYNVLMWHENGLLVCAVSALDDDDLMEMLFDAQQPEDPLKV